MTIIKEKYSDRRVNTIYQILMNEKESGHPKEFDISVDNLKVVYRTNDPEKFFSHEDFIQEDTKSIVINVYIGNSRRSDRYILLLKDEDATNHTLEGIEKSIDEKITQERNKWEYNQLLNEYNKLLKEHEECEEYNDTLILRIESMETEKQDKSNRITDTIIGLAGAYLSKNPNVLNGIPLIGNFLKSSSESVPIPETYRSNGLDGQCSYTDNNQEENLVYTGNITEIDSGRLHRSLIPLFPEQYIPKVSNVIRYMCHNHHLIEEIHGLLEEAVNQQEKNKKKTA